MSLVALRALEVGYDGRPILPPIDLEVDRQTYLGVVGPNGCGKTTLVRTLLGLLAPVAGEVVHDRAPRFGYVPQRPEVERAFPLSTLDLVRFARARRGHFLAPLGATATRAALAALDQVGIADLARRPLDSLSGGQRQRALIARALATEPEILVLDEPTNGMDIVAERTLLDLVAGLRHRLSLAVVLVSHNLGLVASEAQSVLLLDRERRCARLGATAEVVTGPSLSTLYGAAVVVDEQGGNRAVFVRRGAQP